MCIATSLGIGGILTAIGVAIKTAAEAVVGAVVSAGTALGITGGVSTASSALPAAFATPTLGMVFMAPEAAAGTAAAGTAATAGTAAAATATTASSLPMAFATPTLGMIYMAPEVAAGASAGSSLPWGTIGAVGLTALGAGASVAGSVLGTVANMQNNQMQSDLAAYLAAREEVNGVLALRQGEHIDLQANQDRLQLHNKMLQSQGDARASFAARGVVLGSGTPNDYEADIADAYDLDSRNLEYDVAMKKWKYQVEAYNHFTQADIYRGQSSAYQSAKSASLLGGLFNTAGSAMSGLASGLSVSSKLGWI